MEQSKAKLFVAILFQMRKVSNLTNSTLTIQGVDSELNRLMGEVLASEEELDFSGKLVPLQKYVTTTRQNLKVFEELNTLLLQLQMLLQQFGTNLNPHV
ncbi:hypothetical protein ACFSYG_08250 [Leeuwenhoekiella polynyae]|uniref:Uncharacterized protein n=1 Tax=Leeuwenhoekiella polynyae TaxID=1550906 RepID=A0A4V1KQ69_9FLAO|nr:hypothetical protein [Leeuwenhoekiella polynyae]RXG20372.1 hypothetical protein DSM02_2543 [Leeuwenhoekiella polynyae]|tara:strand:- start:88 stop:384 length:297 start_codon:yes stop_codon:yes gene_type:complete